MRWFATIMTIGIWLGATVAAQTPDASLARRGHEALQQGRYLEADTLLKTAALNADGSVRDEDAFQSWSQIHPMLTGEMPVGGLRSTNQESLRLDTKDVASLAAAIPHDAISEITRRASATSIVILNEAHDSPRDRVFALEVARALRPLGYSYLAAETFNNASDWGGQPSTVDKLLRDGFVRRDTGYYTADPVFAGFVREALRLGYRPVSYEQTEAQGIADPAGTIAMREEAEANNLKDVLRTHPNAKLFIYVGYHHVAESPIGNSGNRNEWMAARLKRKTGIDPLTIDQTTLTDRDPTVTALYNAVAARISRPSVLEAGNRPIVVGELARAVDLQVVQPTRSYRYGRPSWLASLGGHPVPIPAAFLSTKSERLVQAFAADAPNDAIPLDQVLLEPGRAVPMLMVPAGRLRFEVQDLR